MLLIVLFTDMTQRYLKKEPYSFYNATSKFRSNPELTPGINRQQRSKGLFKSLRRSPRPDQKNFEVKDRYSPTQSAGVPHSLFEPTFSQGQFQLD